MLSKYMISEPHVEWPVDQLPNLDLFGYVAMTVFSKKYPDAKTVLKHMFKHMLANWFQSRTGIGPSTRLSRSPLSGQPVAPFGTH